MTITRWHTLGLVFCICGVVAWIIFSLVAAHWLPHVPWTAPCVIVLVAGVAVIFGWPVRQYTHGNRRELDHLRAAWVLGLAKTCSLGGAGFAGLYAAQVVVLWSHTGQPLSHGQVWAAITATASGIVCAAAGLAVEHFCKLPPQDGEETDSLGAA